MLYQHFTKMTSNSKQSRQEIRNTEQGKISLLKE